MLALRLPQEIEERLTALAKRLVVQNLYATQAILEKIEDLEDYYAGEAAYREYVAEGRNSRPIDEVWKDLGLDS